MSGQEYWLEKNVVLVYNLWQKTECQRVAECRAERGTERRGLHKSAILRRPAKQTFDLRKIVGSSFWKNPAAPSAGISIINKELVILKK